MPMTIRMTQRPTVRPGELGLRGIFFFLTMGRVAAFGTFAETLQQFGAKYNHD
jgi:hypothetical protein